MRKLKEFLRLPQSGGLRYADNRHMTQRMTFGTVRHDLIPRKL